MTINDLLKKIKDKDKVIVLVDGKGWCNLDFVKETEGTIEIKPDLEPLFND